MIHHITVVLLVITSATEMLSWPGPSQRHDGNVDYQISQISGRRKLFSLDKDLENDDDDDDDDNGGNNDVEKDPLDANATSSNEELPGLETDVDDHQGVFISLSKLKAMLPGPGVRPGSTMPVPDKENGEKKDESVKRRRKRGVKEIIGKKWDVIETKTSVISSTGKRGPGLYDTVDIATNTLKYHPYNDSDTMESMKVKGEGIVIDAVDNTTSNSSRLRREIEMSDYGRQGKLDRNLSPLSPNLTLGGSSDVRDHFKKKQWLQNELKSIEILMNATKRRLGKVTPAHIQTMNDPSQQDNIPRSDDELNTHVDRQRGDFNEIRPGAGDGDGVGINTKHNTNIRGDGRMNYEMAEGGRMRERDMSRQPDRVPTSDNSHRHQGVQDYGNNIGSGNNRLRPYTENRFGGNEVRSDAARMFEELQWIKRQTNIVKMKTANLERKLRQRYHIKTGPSRIGYEREDVRRGRQEGHERMALERERGHGIPSKHKTKLLMPGERMSGKLRGHTMRNELISNTKKKKKVKQTFDRLHNDLVLLKEMVDARDKLEGTYETPDMDDENEFDGPLMLNKNTPPYMKAAANEKQAPSDILRIDDKISEDHSEDFGDEDELDIKDSVPGRTKASVLQKVQRRIKRNSRQTFPRPQISAKPQNRLNVISYFIMKPRWPTYTEKNRGEWDKLSFNSLPIKRKVYQRSCNEVMKMISKLLQKWHLKSFLANERNRHKAEHTKVESVGSKKVVHTPYAKRKDHLKSLLRLHEILHRARIKSALNTKDLTPIKMGNSKVKYLAWIPEKVEDISLHNMHRDIFGMNMEDSHSSSRKPQSSHSAHCVHKPVKSHELPKNGIRSRMRRGNPETKSGVIFKKKEKVSDQEKELAREFHVLLKIFPKSKSETRLEAELYKTDLKQKSGFDLNNAMKEMEKDEDEDEDMKREEAEADYLLSNFRFGRSAAWKSLGKMTTINRDSITRNGSRNVTEHYVTASMKAPKIRMKRNANTSVMSNSSSVGSDNGDDIEYNNQNFDDDIGILNRSVLQMMDFYEGKQNSFYEKTKSKREVDGHLKFEDWTPVPPLESEGRPVQDENPIQEADIQDDYLQRAYRKLADERDKMFWLRISRGNYQWDTFRHLDRLADTLLWGGGKRKEKGKESKYHSHAFTERLTNVPENSHETMLDDAIFDYNDNVKSRINDIIDHSRNKRSRRHSEVTSQHTSSIDENSLNAADAHTGGDDRFGDFREDKWNDKESDYYDTDDVNQSKEEKGEEEGDHGDDDGNDDRENYMGYEETEEDEEDVEEEEEEKEDELEGYNFDENDTDYTDDTDADDDEDKEITSGDNIGIEVDDNGKKQEAEESFAFIAQDSPSKQKGKRKIEIGQLSY